MAKLFALMASKKLLFLSCLVLFNLVNAQDQTGFISIDCGLQPEDSHYTDTSTGLKYVSDSSYTVKGTSSDVAYENRGNLMQSMWSVRSFPDGIRNCYTVSVSYGTKYLIRAGFMYGNYDLRNEIPEFDLHLGPNKWDTVKFESSLQVVSKEIVYYVLADTLQVCLVNTGNGSPFISVLELRPLLNSTYVTQSDSIQLYQRLDFGGSINQTVRFPDDMFDRIWSPSTPLGSRQLSSASTLNEPNGTNTYRLPQAVMRTAIIPDTTTGSLDFGWTPDDPSQEFYFYLYITEIQERKAKESREFELLLNGNVLTDLISLNTLANLVLRNQEPMSKNKFQFSIRQTPSSSLPPLINAMDVYFVHKLPQASTEQNDLSAMSSIKSAYKVQKNWEGDVCVPQDYTWKGVNCSVNGTSMPRVIALSLKESQLTGTITSDISKLTQLSQLDLSNNDLSGGIPAFFADMKLLTLIDLSNNDLSGEIPAFFADMKLLRLINLSGNTKLNNSVPDSLQQRINSNSLTLILNETNKKSRTSHHNYLVLAIGASVAGVFGLLIIMAIIFFVTRKNHNTSQGPSIISKHRMISYPEVLKMTNNFEKVLGQGGFGTVYHGNFDDTQVAVKMLSHSSAQGYKEFKAEVELLLRVHYIHLVGLVGYCDDGDNFALIYEYMANGDLRENLSGKRGGNVLTWGNRMQIALEAAQGLEYLHNGCRPPMVHRDVKTTNILLNERFGAKLADFGLSRSFSVDGETHSMTVVAGTPGYLDPEYYRTNRLSEKSDVYSFGVVLLEIVTNQPVIDETRERRHIKDWVGLMLTKGDIKSTVDPKLMGDYDTNGVWKIVELALSCVNPSSSRRPTMVQVVMELNECVALETARRQGGQLMHSVDYNLSSTSKFDPGAR